MKSWKIYLLLLFMIMGNFEVFGQNDTLIMINGEILTGEIKMFDNGVVTIETMYSDNDFEVEWEKVEQISTIRQFVVIMTDGNRYFGTLTSEKDDPSIVLIDDIKEGQPKVNISDILFLKKIDKTFWSRVDLMISIGYTMTKANNSHQFSGNLKAGYVSSKFKSDFEIGAIRSFQQDDEFTSNVSRTNGGLGFLFFIVRDWFAVVRSDLLQSSEQQLNVRALTKGGVGNYVFKSNRMNLGVAGGAAWNFEDYSEINSTDRNSAEAFAAIEYNIFNLGDLDLLTYVVAYPSFTERGRFRTDFSFNVKYEFKFDLFINVGFTMNYDNQPVEGSTPFDYILQTSLGWEL